MKWNTMRSLGKVFPFSMSCLQLKNSTGRFRWSIICKLSFGILCWVLQMMTPDIITAICLLDLFFQSKCNFSFNVFTRQFSQIFTLLEASLCWSLLYSSCTVILLSGVQLIVRSFKDFFIIFLWRVSSPLSALGLLTRDLQWISVKQHH